MIRAGLRILAGTLALGIVATSFAGSLAFRTDLPGAFLDISSTGTSLGLSGDEVAEIGLPVNNAVFAGSSCWVANNGVVGLETAHAQPPVTAPIPSPDIWGGDQALLPFGDDIGNDTGDILWELRTTDGRGDVLIIQWHDKRFTGSNDTARFQVKIFSDPGPNYIYAQFLYDDIEQPFPNGGAIATIGYQDGGVGFNDVPWSYHTAGAVADRMVMLQQGRIMRIGPRAGFEQLRDAKPETLKTDDDRLINQFLNGMDTGPLTDAAGMSEYENILVGKKHTTATG